jgi:hypothetical protein
MFYNTWLSHTEVDRKFRRNPVRKFFSIRFELLSMSILVYDSNMQLEMEQIYKQEKNNFLVI